MRDHRTLRRPARFAFWTSGELARLSMIAAVCAAPFSILTEPDLSCAPQQPRAKSAAAQSAGRLRAIRVTDYDLTHNGPSALGDAD